MVITKNWETGGGAVTITYDGDGDGTISVSSDVNSGAPRQMVLAVSNDYGQSVDLTVKQNAVVLPEGYTRLQYIRYTSYSSGRPRINTGYRAVNTMGLRTIIRHKYTDSTARSLVGCTSTQKSDSTYDRFLIRKTAAGKLDFGWGNSTSVDVIPAEERPDFPNNEWADISLNFKNCKKWSFECNGISAEGDLPSRSWSKITNYNIMFAGHNGYSQNMDTQEAILTSGTEVVKHLFPCRRESDGEVGMYDVINNNFVVPTRSDSSWKFTAGPDWE